MKFYLSFDKKSGLYYVVPFDIDAAKVYMISFDIKVEAEKFMNKLNFESFPDPLQKEDRYELVGVVEDGEVKIFRPKLS